MILTDLLSELKRKNIHLYLENGGLRGKFPPATNTPELKTALQNHKVEIIEYLQQTNLDESYALIPANRENNLLLSYSQERLWFLDQFEGGAPYNMPGAVRLTGELDRSVLRRSLNEIIRRHEVLRTTFALEEGRAVQVIAGELALEVEVMDLSGLVPTQREAEVQRRLTQEAQTPFDLAQGPLVRASLLFLGSLQSTGTTEHVLLFTMHHIVSDGWSTAILIREFITLYEAYSKHRPSPLPELSIQYADYAQWQRNWLQGARLEQQVGYWKQQLAGAAAVLELPTDRPRPVVQSHRGATLYANIPQSVTEQLKRLGQRQDATLFMVLLAAFNILLSRYSGQTDLCVGTPVANRNRLEIEGLIGFFINTLVLRTDLSGNPSFTELLQRVREVCLGAQTHQDLPFEKLVEELAPVRDMSHHPLFQVMLALQNTPKTALEIEGLKITPEVLEAGAAKFDLDLEITESKQGLAIQFSYNTDLFDAPTIARMAEHYGILLEHIAAAPDGLLSELELLTPLERNQLLVEWNATQAEYPRVKCIHQLFEEQVALNPDAIAVVFEGKQLTYGELNKKANQLAHYLRAQGIGAEMLVGICVERSLEMIIAILGILKAGGAYLPIDPDYPHERIAFMVEDARPVVILIHEPTRGAVPDSLKTLDLVSEDNTIVQFSEENPACLAAVQNLAYVIYTSGSTGKPKGSSLAHQGVVNRVVWMQQHYQLSENDRVLQKTPFSFDVSVWEFFWPLITGAKLVVLSPGAHKDSARIAELIRQEQISTLHFVPSMLSVFLEAAEAVLCPSLRQVFSSGEALSTNLQKQFFAKIPAAKLHNLYGPTEASIDVTYWACIPNSGDAVVPIGRPIANTRIYLLDAHLNPVPVGVAGELYIGGIGLARGYFNWTDLTAERFIPDAFDATGGRLYRTGDLARYRSDGNIEYIGRSDNQVKIRGFRIELGEIEAVLAQHAQVNEVAVIAREDRSGDKRLVAYISGIDANLSSDDLKTYLKAHLPDYMVPAAFVFVQRLPLSTNGKLDRKALPEPDTGTQPIAQYVAPRNAIEELLAKLWAEVLGLEQEQVGVHDNFFELGGHSLLAMRLIESIRRRGFHADVRALFVTQTLAEFAALLGNNSVTEVPANQISAPCTHIKPEMLPLVALKQTEIDSVIQRVPGGALNVQDIYALTPLQEGILFHHLISTQGDPYLLSSLMAFATRDRLDRLLSALQAVVDRHDILRTAILWEELSAPVQVVLRAAALPVTEVALNSSSGDAARQLQERFDPGHFRMDIRQAPLIQGYVAWDAHQDRWLLLILVHHLASDHVAMEVVLKEIRAHLSGQFDQLPPPLPFRNFVARIRMGMKFEEHETFFTKLLRNVDEPTAPFGLLDVQRDGSGIAEAVIDLDDRLDQRIRAFAHSIGVSAASVFHLAWAQVLALICGKETVVFGTVLFGRTQNGDEADRMLGMFINTLPVCFDVNGMDCKTGIQRMHRLLAELMRHEHASLALAQRCSGVPAPVPLFSTLLNYRHSIKESDAAEDVNLSSWESMGVKVLNEDERTNYPFTLSIDDFGNGFRLTMQVQSPIEPQRIIGYMRTALSSLADALASDRAKAIATLDVLSASEREQVLNKWNTIKATCLQDECIHELFEKQARQQPAAIAVTCDDRQLTYGELNAQANHIAHGLRARGVGPEVLVGLFFERSLEMIIGILGVLKAGGAYLPIDPNYPQERIAFMIEDAKPEVMLTHSALMKSIPNGIATLCVDQDLSDQSDHDSGNPVSMGTGGNLAYVIYTSGSTGKPKGVMVTHFNVRRLFAVTEQEYAFSAKDVWTLFHSYAFDFSVWEIWGALLYGGRLIVVPDWIRRSPHAFHRLLQERGVTVLNQTPTSFYQVDNVDRQTLKSGLLALRLIIFGGEALEPSQFGAWFERHGDARPQLVNMYGITETTVHVTWASLKQSDAQRSGNSIVGRPLSDLQAFILDRQGNPAPIGVQGELFIGGSGLARGYLNRADLTAERFVPHPFDDQGGARLYRTGDLARYGESGAIEYLGRIDQQVKIRGFRIELGEIEGVLAQHALIKEVVVLARENVPGEKRLVAYVAIDQSENTAVHAADDLRAYLKERLPDYMVPVAWVFLDSLPLTLNGKIDRKALPEPDIGTQIASRYMAPRNTTEEILANIWAQVLRLEQIGIDDNFFALGGDSIRSIQVVGLAKERGLTVPMEQLYKCGTIRSLAQILTAIDSAMIETANLEPFAIISIEDLSRLPAGIQDAYPLTEMQAGMIFHSEQEPGAYHVVDSIKIQCVLDAEILRMALEQVFDRHPVLRTSFDLGSFSEPLQIVHQQCNVPLVVHDLSHLSPIEQEKVLADYLQSIRSDYFDVSNLPLIRFSVHYLTEDKLQFTVVAHHAIIDGWSLVSLLIEVFQRCSALQQGQLFPTQPLPNAMRNLVVRERKALNTDTDQEFWKLWLSSATINNFPRLISDLDDSSGPEDQWPEVQLSIPRELSEKLKQLAQSLAVPLKSVLLAAHLRILSLLYGETNVTTGLITSVRPEELNGDQALGVFLNTLPLCAQLKGGTWSELIIQAFVVERKMLNARYYPLASLQRLQNSTVLFDTTFNYLHYHVGEAFFNAESVKITEWNELGQSNFVLDVTFNLEIDSQEIKLTLQGDREWLNRKNLARIGEYFISALSAITHDPSKRYDADFILGASEQYQLLLEWKGIEAEPPRDRCIHQIFEEQADINSSAAAVVFEGKQLTYEQLNRKANRLAHYLRSQGVGVEELVGICVDRSLEMIIGILGILKAGGVYLPLDPELPSGRLHQILRDAGTQWVLTQSEFTAQIPDSCRTVNLDCESEGPLDEYSPVLALNGQQLAYMLYTSGTTGIPKGVGVNHNNLVNQFFAWDTAYELQGGDVHLQMARYTFDVFAGDWIRALCSGGKLVICPRETLLQPEQLYALMQREQVTVAEFVPAVLRLLTEYLEQTGQRLAFMKLLICGSDRWYVSECQKFLKLCDQETRLINSYGLTEATIDSTYFETQKVKSLKQELVPIGKGFANTCTYILDRWLNPAPIGVPGELYIGGAGVVRGYFNWPELTAERFIPNPFNDKLGERLYKTGDVVRYMPDGNIEHLGRTDHQVKIRGLRIELEEIEAILLQYPGISEAVVVARDESAIVAYVIGNDEEPDIDDLRAHLRAYLPDYMVPAAFVVLDCLPVNINGKVDRKALPAPDIDNRFLRQYVAPRTPTEEAIALIWAGVLGLERVGIQDNFFELGGHSLLATQAIARVRMAFSIDLPFSVLLRTPTIECMSVAVEEAVVSSIELLTESEAEDILEAERW